jgi:uncharacterized protein YecT (DUF1311 family)
MPNVNLSSLSGPELRRLLDSSRQRGEAALSYRILQEMEARREGGERKRLFAGRRSAEAHTVAINLGDPLERDDEDDVPPMPSWRPPPQVAEVAAAPEPEPAPIADPSPRRSRRRNAQPEAAAAVAPPADDVPEPPPLLAFRVPDPEPLEDAEGAKDWDLRLPPPRQTAAGPPRGLRRGLAAGFAVGIAAGVSLGWWVWGVAREGRSPLPAAVASPIKTAALEPASVPTQPALVPVVAEPPPTPEAAPEPAIAAAPPVTEVSPPAPDAPQVAPEAPPEGEPVAPPPLPVHRHADMVRTADASAGPNGTCAAQPTPADRTICGDPELKALQRELRLAYNEALEAHENRALLRQRQLAWASARDTVTDSGRLAQLYEQRIRKLNAATAEARQR